MTMDVSIVILMVKPPQMIVDCKKKIKMGCLLEKEERAM
jgi:hypothetical protein